MPINGRVLLDIWLKNLYYAGVDEFIINIHYKADLVKEFVKRHPLKNKIRLVYEKELLGTAGTILKNKKFFKNDFFVIHADNLVFCDFKKFIKVHENRPKECNITMMLFYSDDPSSCGVVELDDKKVVKKFYEKVKDPPSNLANGAVYICDKEVVKFIEKTNAKDFSKDVLPNFIGKIYTFLNDNYHRDIGTLKSYALAQIETFEKFRVPI